MAAGDSRSARADGPSGPRPSGEAGPGPGGPREPAPSPRDGSDADASARRAREATDAARATSASSDTRPRFPSFGAATPQSSAPLSPPPPRASARFPDAPPTAGREAGHESEERAASFRAEPRSAGRESDGRAASFRDVPSAGRETGGRTAPFPGVPQSAGRKSEDRAAAFREGPQSAGRETGGRAPSYPDGSATAGRATRRDTVAGAGAETVPPRPEHRPAPRRTGAPAETSSETTARLRPVPGDASAPPGESFGLPGAAAAGMRPGPAAEEERGRRTAAGTAESFGQHPGAGQPYVPAARTGSARTPSAPAESTAPVHPDPAFSWSAPMAPGGTPGAGRPVVSFGEPEGYDEDARPRPLGRRGRAQAVAAAVCLVLGMGLISGAVTGSWLVGDSGAAESRSTFAAAGSLWHSVPVDQLFPPTVAGQGAGPGGADRTWTRVAVAPDSGCEGAFDPLLRKALAPVGCERLLRATYTDATQSHVTTVGLLFTRADATAMAALAGRFETERLDRRSDLMPLPYAAQDTAAARFGARQRASWAISVLTDAPVVVYAVSGWADGRGVDDPQPAGDAMASGATTAPAQAGLGHEAQGLADRIERGLRKNVRSATEQPS
ncbi:hypothetical protein GCM10027074_22830 [Streptomyces deserti]